MSQSDLAHGVWSADGQPSDDTTPHRRDSENPVTVEAYRALLAKIEQANVLDRERISRIYHLEQALDQALICLDELQLKIQDQELLEAQLVKTEEFATVQQQAIARLQLQLQHQQTVLDHQNAEAQKREQVMQELLTVAQARAQTQQSELENLRSQLAHERETRQLLAIATTVLPDGTPSLMPNSPSHMAELEAELLSARTRMTSLEIQLSAAQTQIDELSTSLNHHQAILTQLEAQTNPASSPYPTVEPLVPTLRWAHMLVIERNATIAALQQELALVQIKVEELETQLAKQVKGQARWQQSSRELEGERDRYKARISTLEVQLTEIQEQILQQAKQASEYEAAIQHWKDRYKQVERYFSHLQALVEQACVIEAPEHDSTIASSSALQHLLDAIQHIPKLEPSDRSITVSRFNPLDVPDFLFRRRNRTR